MKKFCLKTLVLSSIFLIMGASLPVVANSDYFCWNNDDDIRECGNYVPPQYSQKGFWKREKSGTWKFVKPAPTAEEIAEMERQKEQERQREEQRKKDEALLGLFSTEKDIENTRTGILNSIAAQIQPTEAILEGLKGNLEDLQESYERSKNNSAVSDSQLNAIQTNINGIKKRIKDTEGTLQDKLNEQIKTNLKYDAYLQRFLEIRLERRKNKLSQHRLEALQEKINEVKERILETRKTLSTLDKEPQIEE